ncbi:MAG: hypothetical protein JW943_13185 [Deltaproteobacteria bacterium]|nr:hypothetical protein [Deltaproteobacteria bacterium]
MPVLHKYVDRDAFYILTRINSNMVTFQLTDEGLRKLQKSRIISGQKFARALLLDLYRSGDVFTQGTGPGVTKVDRQLELDFSNDPEPETLFPSCSVCKSIDDLHLVELIENDRAASILCHQCRSKEIAIFDTSVPLTLVSRTVLNRLIAMKGIKKLDASVVTYKELLDAEFESKWDAYRKGNPEQTLLLDIDDSKQPKLI